MQFTKMLSEGFVLFLVMIVVFSTGVIAIALDTEPPVITLLGVDSVTVEWGSGYVDAGATALDDFDGDITASIVTNNPVDTMVITLYSGPYIVTYDVSDNSGNPATQVTRTVNVVDTTPPFVEVPGDMIVEATGFETSIDASVTANDAVDGWIGTVCDPIPSGPFPIGTTTVYCSATDYSGNTGYNSFTVTVQDTTPPFIDPIPDQVYEATSLAGANVNYLLPNAYDSVSEAVVNCIPGPGEWFVLGSTIVMCTAMDNAGNTADPKLFSITVVDTTPPYISLIGSETVNVMINTEYNDEGANAFDDVDGDLTPLISVSNPVDTSILGIYAVTYVVSDSSGNSARASRTVNVVDDLTPPTVSSGNVEVSISNDANDNGRANPGDFIKVTWDNSADGDNNNDVASVSVDFSLVGGITDASANDVGIDCDSIENDGIWSACYNVDSGTIDGQDLGFTIIVVDNSRNSASALSENTVFVDNKFPELVSARTTSPTSIEVVFSEAIDGAELEIDGSDFRFDSGFSAVGASADGNIVTLTVSPEMPADHTDSVFINYMGSTVQDLSANVLIDGGIMVIDRIAPMLLSARTTSPSEVLLSFDETINWDSVCANTFVVGDYYVANAFVSEIDNTQVIIALDDVMPANATPTISLFEGDEGNDAASFSDVNGNQQWSASVVASDGIAPALYVVHATAPDIVEVVFSEDLNEDELTLNDFAFYRNNGEGPYDPIAITELSENNGIVTLTLESELVEGDNPQLIINPSVPESIKDIAGNEYTARNEQQDVGDSIAPEVRIAQQVIIANANTIISFMASATDIFAGVSDAYWEFGNGASAGGLEAGYAYESNGEYNATLVVTDYEGNSGRSLVIALIGNVTFSPLPNMSLTFINVPDDAYNISIVENSTAGVGTTGFQVAGNFFEVVSSLPNGGFNVTLEFKYGDEDDDGIVDGTTISEALIDVYYYNGTWITVPNPVRDAKANTIAVTVDHFTLFSILTPASSSPPSSPPGGGGGGGGKKSNPNTPVPQPTVGAGYFSLPALPETLPARASEENVVRPEPVQFQESEPAVMPQAGDRITGAVTGATRNTNWAWLAALLVLLLALIGSYAYYKYKSK